CAWEHFKKQTCTYINPIGRQLIFDAMQHLPVPNIRYPTGCYYRLPQRPHKHDSWPSQEVSLLDRPPPFVTRRKPLHKHRRSPHRRLPTSVYRRLRPSWLLFLSLEDSHPSLCKSPKYPDYKASRNLFPAGGRPD